ncbi:MAG: biliverdin-producing heme oxygenase [Coxiellaceae bacterium]|nr:biliverdin-producing heme oxygenase [Coxiellaceae bacterium]
MKFSDLLLQSTYQNGQPGKGLTAEHESVEKHPFKTQHMLVKGKKIPKAAYTQRLIQQFFIFATLEKQLLLHLQQATPELQQALQLPYFFGLCRFKLIQKDLQQLGAEPNSNRVLPATREYVTHIEALSPLATLTHFTLHTVGLMYGGSIVQRNHIRPSNKKPGHQIPNNIYDFKDALSGAGLNQDWAATRLARKWFDDLNATIIVSDDKADDVVTEGKTLYAFMAKIYDQMQQQHQQRQFLKKACVAVGVLSVFAVIAYAQYQVTEQQNSLQLTM